MSDVGVDTAAHRFLLLKLSSPRRQTTSWTGLEALRRLAEEYPLVIVTNADDVHASRLVDPTGLRPGVGRGGHSPDR